MPRRTRIVATLGTATDRPDILRALLRVGVDVARINFSHGTVDEHLQRIARLREAARELGRVQTLPDRPTGRASPPCRVRLMQPPNSCVREKKKPLAAITRPFWPFIFSVAVQFFG